MRARSLILPSLLAAAVAVPIVSSKSPDVAKKARSLIGSISGGAASDGNRPYDSQRMIPESAKGSPIVDSDRFRHVTDVPLEGMPIQRIEDVLRLDVSIGWVYQRWSRKTTALSDLNLYGVRVPLVTGTEIDDLAGSLTYYFNPEGQVQRISFRGRTGDTRKLVSLVVSRYGFRRQTPSHAGENLYQVRWNAKPISELRIRPAPVVWSTSPHTSFEVELELERPGSGRFLRPANGV